MKFLGNNLEEYFNAPSIVIIILVLIITIWYSKSIFVDLIFWIVAIIITILSVKLTDWF